MVYVEITEDKLFDNNCMFIEIDEEDVNSICYDFDIFLEHLLETANGRILQRIGDVVLFQVEDIERVYGICKDEYMRLIFTFQVQLGSFTMKEYDKLMTQLAIFGMPSSELII